LEVAHAQLANFWPKRDPNPNLKPNPNHDP